MTKKAKIWYSFLEGVSQEDHIGFYESTDFDWVPLVEKNAAIITSEISTYLQDNEEKIKPYFNAELVSKKNKWKTSSFLVWTWRVNKNRKLCPKTMEVLQKIPGLVSASISILEANTTINPHRGDTNAIVRAHLGLKIPAQLPDCGFKVKYEDRSWEEGKVLLFNDAARHTAWNNTDERRYVLLFDVIRPQYQNKKYTVASLVLAGLVMQGILGKAPFLTKLPRILLGIGLYSISFIIQLLLRIRAITYTQ